MRFDGATYDPERDGERLGREMTAVARLMLDGEWRTLAYISETLEMTTGIRYPEASISARLRDLRKPRFGSHTVERRYCGAGLWEYRVNDPYRCLACGAPTSAVIHSSDRPQLDARYATLDDRYATQACPFCRKTVVAARAATPDAAKALRREPAPKTDAEQLKGGW